MQSNVTGVLNILEVAKRHKAKTVFVSTSCAYGDRYLNPYALSKVHGEELCTLYHKLHKLSIAIARLFNVYGHRSTTSGPYSTVIGVFREQTEKKQRLSIVGDGEQRRDFIHVLDVVDCLIQLSKGKRDCDLFQVGTGTNYSVNEVAEMFQPGAKRKWLKQRPGEMRETKANLDLTLTKWNAKRKLQDFVNEVSRTGSQSDA
jgi:UDP-glucose 4-epimerase